jgi:hypothetical protein
MMMFSERFVEWIEFKGRKVPVSFKKDENGQRFVEYDGGSNYVPETPALVAEAAKQQWRDLRMIAFEKLGYPPTPEQRKAFHLEWDDGIEFVEYRGGKTTVIDHKAGGIKRTY